MRGVYKRDKKNEGKQFFLYFEGKMVVHHWEINFTLMEK